jgi:hypothetical protein
MWQVRNTGEGLGSEEEDERLIDRDCADDEEWNQDVGIR